MIFGIVAVIWAVLRVNGGLGSTMTMLSKIQAEGTEMQGAFTSFFGPDIFGLLTPAEFERLSLPHGTVAIMADPHEIANVAGTEGIDYMIKLCENLSMRVYFNMPSCVPAAPLEESGETLEADDISPYYTDDRVLGLAEVMNSYGVTCGDEKLLKKIIDAKNNNKIIDGHISRSRCPM